VHEHVHISVTTGGAPQKRIIRPFLPANDPVPAVFTGCWAVVGDFNLLLDPADKNNALLNRCSMERFRRLLNDQELKVQPLVGWRYTWSNERRTPTMEKLDRWFSVDWDANHPECLLQVLLSSISDHCPIMMSTNFSMHRKARFHFQSFCP
jgi:hypothetical protein